jgi:hypothetical protein
LLTPAGYEKQSKIAYIFCKEMIDAQILKALIPELLLSGVEIFPGGGISSLTSLARSLMVRRQVPIGIVVDNDTLKSFQEHTKEIEENVKSVAIDAPVKVWEFMPAIEILFFQDIDLLSRLLGYKPSKEDLDLAVSQPKKVLEQLIARSEAIGNQTQFIDQLAHEDLRIIQGTPIIQELMDFLQAIRQPATV